MQEGDVLGLEGVDQIYRVVTSHMKKALLAMSEVGAVKMMGEENREAARLSVGSLEHI